MLCKNTCQQRRLPQSASSIESQHLLLHLSGSDNEESMSESSAVNQERVPNELGLEIIRGSGDELSDEMWREIEDGAPSKLEAMKAVSSV